MNRKSGLTLVEVLIAGVLLTIVALGALRGLKSTVGFVTRTGRFTQTTPLALELGERNRIHVAPSTDPIYTITPGTDTVTMLQIPGTRTLGVVSDPCAANPAECPQGNNGAPGAQLRKVTIEVNWNEPKN